VGEALVTRDTCADAKTWEQVNKLAGFAEGLAFVVNLRDMTKRAQEQEKVDATL
jgi:hypothetical protein